MQRCFLDLFHAVGRGLLAIGNALEMFDAGFFGEGPGPRRFLDRCATKETADLSFFRCEL